MFHTLVYVSYLSNQHDSIDHATNGMEEYFHSRFFYLTISIRPVIHVISRILTTATSNVFVFNESVFCVE